nr:MAG TPA: hypothetical protein [Bacteriophage sp.]
MFVGFWLVIIIFISFQSKLFSIILFLTTTFIFC